MRGTRLLLLVVTAVVAAGALLVARGAPWPLSSAGRSSSTFAALERAPGDASLWLRLGDEAQRDGDLPLARAAFRAAQELAPNDGTAYARLGFVLYEEGRDTEALEALRRARERGADVAMLDFTLSMMKAHVDLGGPFPRFSEEKAPAEPLPTARADGDIPPRDEDAEAPVPVAAPEDDEHDDDVGYGDEPAEEHDDGTPREQDEDPPDPPDDDPDDDELDEGRGPAIALGPDGACEVALERRGEQGIFVIDALVNGTPARLIVDTGASLTVLSREFLDETGLDLDEDGVLTARTAGGPQRFATAAVDSVEVGTRVATGIRVAICEACGMPGSDGLLGLDVQEPLGMSLFPGRGTVRFADCFE